MTMIVILMMREPAGDVAAIECAEGVLDLLARGAVRENVNRICISIRMLVVDRHGRQRRPLPRPVLSEPLHCSRHHHPHEGLGQSLTIHVCVIHAQNATSNKQNPSHNDLPKKNLKRKQDTNKCNSQMECYQTNATPEGHGVSAKSRSAD